MFPNTSSPSTTLEGPSSPFFPWPFLDDVDEELFPSQMLSQQHNNAPVTHDAPVHVSNIGANNLPTTARANMISCEGDSVAMKAMIPKKAKHLVINQKEKKKKKKKKMEIIPSNRRAGKKDRHSKICTAQGLRDRRMRLSLEIARKFFDLQDMLGFDKASKTIEWLLKNCKAAIQQLTHSHGGEKSMSFSASEESEVESEAKEMEIKQICEEEQEEEPLVGIACRKKRKRRKSCNEVGAMIITNIHVARESRDKARARARERTREKLMMVKGQLDQNSNTKSTESYPPISNKHHHLHAAGHQDSGNNSSPQADLFEELQASVAVMEEELLGITRSSSSSTFSYNSPDFAANHNKEFPGFLAIQKGLEATIEPAPGCYRMTSIKPSLGNVQVQNIPNEMFRTTMNAQEYDSPPDPSSTFMTISNGGQWNPSSIFVTAPAGTLDQQNPFPNSSILMTRKSNSITTPMFTATRPNNVSFQSHFQGSQFP